MQEGLKVKYNVTKVSDGSIVNNCFVLRPDKDSAAVVALRAYAATTENKALAADIVGWIGEEPNEPLTLEKLHKGDVVWIKDLITGEIECLRFDRIEPATYHSGDDYRFEQFGTDVGIIRWGCKYGINWIACRRNPESRDV